MCATSKNRFRRSTDAEVSPRPPSRARRPPSSGTRRPSDRSAQDIVGRRQQRVPLRAFDVNLQHDALRAVAILGELVLHRSKKRPSIVAVVSPTHSVMKDGVADKHARLRGVEAVVLVDRHLGFARYRSPTRRSRRCRTIAGLDAAQQVAAHQVAAVVGLAESLQLAVGERDRPEHLEQRLSPLHHPRRAVPRLDGADASRPRASHGRAVLSTGCERSNRRQSRRRSSRRRQRRAEAGACSHCSPQLPPEDSVNG